MADLATIREELEDDSANKVTRPFPFFFREIQIEQASLTEFGPHQAMQEKDGWRVCLNQRGRGDGLENKA